MLDAPELQDDFYLNLVDWSSLNVLSVGLGTCVYLWSACTSQVGTQAPVLLLGGLTSTAASATQGQAFQGCTQEGAAHMPLTLTVGLGGVLYLLCHRAPMLREAECQKFDSYSTGRV